MVHRALAALLKELSKTGSADMAFEIFDWLRSLDEDHELAGLCDVYTYTTMIVSIIHAKQGQCSPQRSPQCSHRDAVMLMLTKVS